MNARLALSRVLSNQLSPRAGVFTHTDVQQQRKMVIEQDQTIESVPRPSGSLLHPFGSAVLFALTILAIFLGYKALF